MRKILAETVGENKQHCLNDLCTCYMTLVKFLIPLSLFLHQLNKDKHHPYFFRVLYFKSCKMLLAQRLAHQRYFIIIHYISFHPQPLLMNCWIWNGLVSILCHPKCFCQDHQRCIFGSQFTRLLPPWNTIFTWPHIPTLLISVLLTSWLFFSSLLLDPSRLSILKIWHAQGSVFSHFLFSIYTYSLGEFI